MSSIPLKKKGIPSQAMKLMFMVKEWKGVRVVFSNGPDYVTTDEEGR